MVVILTLIDVIWALLKMYLLSVSCVLIVLFSFKAPKNEDAYEISIPFEENNYEQQGGFYNQNDQNFDSQCESLRVVLVQYSTIRHYENNYSQGLNILLKW